MGRLSMGKFDLRGTFVFEIEGRLKTSTRKQVKSAEERVCDSLDGTHASSFKLVDAQGLRWTNVGFANGLFGIPFAVSSRIIVHHYVWALLAFGWPNLAERFLLIEPSTAAAIKKGFFRVPIRILHGKMKINGGPLRPIQIP